jgi:hypothetical protein
MAFFGYPEAQDNDAERAARAGLELLDAIAKLGSQAGAPNWRNESVSIQVRWQLERAPAKKPTYSAKLPISPRACKAAAEPGTVLITDAVHQLVSGFFVVASCGASALKGIEREFRHRGPSKAAMSRASVFESRFMPSTGYLCYLKKIMRPLLRVCLIAGFTASVSACAQSGSIGPLNSTATEDQQKLIVAHKAGMAAQQACMAQYRQASHSGGVSEEVQQQFQQCLLQARKPEFTIARQTADQRLKSDSSIYGVTTRAIIAGDSADRAGNNEEALRQYQSVDENSPPLSPKLRASIHFHHPMKRFHHLI